MFVPDVDRLCLISSAIIVSILFSAQTTLKSLVDTKLATPLLNVPEKQVRVLYALQSLRLMPPYWIFYFIAYVFSGTSNSIAAFFIVLLIVSLIYALIALGIYYFPIRTQPDPEFRGLAKIRFINYGVKGLLYRITNDDPEIGKHVQYLLSQNSPYSAIQYLTARTGVGFDKARYLLPLLTHHYQNS